MTKGKAIGVISIKGGVGKTTSVINLANVLANDFNKKVVIIDANFSSPNIALHLGNIDHKYSLGDLLNKKAKLSDVVHEHEFGFHVIPTSLASDSSNKLRLKQVVQNLKNNYDIVLLDSSPTMNDEILATIMASDELYVVSTPDLPTLTTTLRAVNIAKNNKMKVNGLILNKVRGKDYELKPIDMERLSGVPLIGVINDNVRVLEALDKVKPVTSLSPNSDVSIAYKKLAAKMINAEYREPNLYTKTIAYLKDDFSNLATHDFTKGISYYK